MEIALFYITTGDITTAETLGNLAIDKKLAACANIFPIQSVFPWEGTRSVEEEQVLILKTTPGNINALSNLIALHHTYQVPCIMHWIVEVNDAYGKWIEENVIGLEH